jgi:hypothetical protein
MRFPFYAIPVSNLQALMHNAGSVSHIEIPIICNSCFKLADPDAQRRQCISLQVYRDEASVNMRDC